MPKKKRKNPKKKPSYSTLEQHKRQGRELIPPLRQMDQLSFHSWVDERLPEMLWAALLIAHLPRESALSIFREVARYAQKFEDFDSREHIDATLSGFAHLESDSTANIIGILTSDAHRRRVLRPLALLEDLPGQEHWKKALGSPDESEDWEMLKIAVAYTLDHQSEEATNCRWARAVFLVLAGTVNFGPTLEETAKEILYYPDYGQMPKVRPSIRSLEGALGGPSTTESDFVSKFWSQCMVRTACETVNLPAEPEQVHVGTTLQRVNDTYARLTEHADRTRTTTATDARHDAVFGIALYALSILQELMRVGTSQSLSARMLLRTLLECFVTLAYLVKNDSSDLWQSYRAFGAGQTKLAFMKLDQSEEQVGYVKVETLKQLANEDMWQEFVPVNLGHWEKSNLRKMSQDADAKSEYDNYYGWTSAFSHAHWGAVRDTVFQICQNPLHRLHRIPMSAPRTQEDVILDACQLVDKVLTEVCKVYPGFDKRTSL